MHTEIIWLIQFFLAFSTMKLQYFTIQYPREKIIAYFSKFEIWDPVYATAKMFSDNKTENFKKGPMIIVKVYST